MSKRSARQIELTYIAEEILEVANARNENGVPLHPEVVTDPVAFVLFNTPDALLDTLVNKPVLLLNLIRTNKVLNNIWRKVPGIWRVLLDNLLAMEEMGDLSKIYPFFVVAQHRVHALAKPIFDTTIKRKNMPVANPIITNEGHPLLPNFGSPVKVIGRTYEGAKYSLIYYDEMTQLFVALLQKLSVFNQAWGLGRPVSYDIIIADYLNITLDEPYIRLVSRPNYVAVLHDCFLVTDNTVVEYHPSVMRSAVNKIVVWFEKLTLLEIEPDSKYLIQITLDEVKAPTSVLEMIRTAKAEAIRLQKVLALPENFFAKSDVLPKRIPLDEEVAKPYRDMLFNQTYGIYNTSESQRELFVNVLSSIYRGRYADGPQEFIWRYGSTLQCSICGKETEHVDPVLLKAFCVGDCRR